MSKYEDKAKASFISMLGILLIPLVMVLKYKPVPPTTIGIFVFLSLIHI